MIMEFQGVQPSIASDVFIAPSADIIGDVTIGEQSSVWFGCVIRGDVNSITIGKRTSIQDLSMIHVTHFKKEDHSDGFATTIGNDVTIAHRVMLHGCTIEDACLIGMSATILDGAIMVKSPSLEQIHSSQKTKFFPHNHSLWEILPK